MLAKLAIASQLAPSAMKSISITTTITMTAQPAATDAVPAYPYHIKKPTARVGLQVQICKNAGYSPMAKIPRKCVVCEPAALEGKRLIRKWSFLVPYKKTDHKGRFLR